MHRIDFLICNYNTGSLIEKCINSILNLNNKELDINIYVYDNNSFDESLDYLQNINNKKIKILFDNLNLGYGKAINNLFNVSTADYIFILNPDTLIKFDSIQLIKLLSKDDSNTKIFGFKIHTPGQEVQQHLVFEPGLFWLFISILRKGYPVFLDIFYNFYFNLVKLLKDKQDSTFLSGCALLMNRNIFKSLNGFNEKYFLYFEDTELLLNAKKQGIILIETDLIIEHNSSFSVKKSNNKIKTEIYKSALIYFKSNFNSIKYFYGKILIVIASIICVCNPINIFSRKNSKYFLELLKVPFNV